MAPTIEMTDHLGAPCEVDDLEPGWGEVALLGTRRSRSCGSPATRCTRSTTTTRTRAHR